MDSFLDSLGAAGVTRFADRRQLIARSERDLGPDMGALGEVTHPQILEIGMVAWEITVTLSGFASG